MTVKELQEQLSKFPENEEVELVVEEIYDNIGCIIDGHSYIDYIEYGVNGHVTLKGFDLYS